MAESLRGKVQVDKERHTFSVPATCPKCAHKWTQRVPITVRVFQTAERVIVNRIVSAVRGVLGKTRQAKAVEKKIREALG